MNCTKVRMAHLRLWLSGRPAALSTAHLKGVRESVRTEAKGQNETRGVSSQPALLRAAVDRPPDNTLACVRGLSITRCHKQFLEDICVYPSFAAPN